MKGGFNIDQVLEIVSIVLPVIIVGVIAIFVVYRMKYKRDQGLLGRKETKNAQNVLDSLIPLGTLFGGIAGLVLSMIFSFPLVFTMSLGAGGGLLAGYVAYEIYSKKEDV